MSVISGGSSGWWRSAGVSAAFVLVFGGAFLIDRLQPGAVAWAGGLLAAAFLQLERRWILPVAIVALGMAAGAAAVTGIAAQAAVATAGLTVAEAGGAAWLIRRLGGGGRLTSWRRLGLVLALGIAPAAGVAALVWAAAATMTGGAFAEAIGVWFYPHLLGLGLVAPMLLLAGGRRPPRPGRSALEQAGLLALLGFAALGAGLSPPLLLVAIPVLTLIAVRLGPAEAAAGAVLATAAASVWGAPQSPLQLQAFAVAAVLACLAPGFAVGERDRLRRILAGRAAVVQRANRRARAATQAKAEFLATMSHEIRTPMASIIGFTQTLLRRDDLAEPARRQLALIDRAGASLLTVVGDVLDCAGISGGEIRLEPRPASPRAVAQDALAIVAEAARRKGLDLGLTVLGPADRLVSLDELRVRQVLLHLLGNAVKFTEAGAVRLDLSAVEENEGLRLRFAVRDTGRGVEAERARRLFEQPELLGDAAPGAGPGLGLSVCKGLVELLGGRIDVQAVPGGGAMFWFEILAPLAEGRVAAAPSALPPLRVLLVEDHPVNRELALAQLQLLGCAVDAVADGAEAVAAAAAAAGYDLILMDVHMPVMDGLAATRAIHARDPGDQKVPILGLSADVTPQTAERCREAGMVALLSKPAGLEDLHAALTRWAPSTANDDACAA